MFFVDFVLPKSYRRTRQSSAACAKQRLRDVVKRDREKVPCGQWERVFETYRGVRVEFEMNGKPIYHYEERR